MKIVETDTGDVAIVDRPLGDKKKTKIIKPKEPVKMKLPSKASITEKLGALLYDALDQMHSAGYDGDGVNEAYMRGDHVRVVSSDKKDKYNGKAGVVMSVKNGSQVVQFVDEQRVYYNDDELEMMSESTNEGVKIKLRSNGAGGVVKKKSFSRAKGQGFTFDKSKRGKRKDVAQSIKAGRIQKKAAIKRRSSQAVAGIQRKKTNARRTSMGLDRKK